MPDSLTNTVLACHVTLRDRIADTRLVSFPRQARDHQSRADAFLISACRHMTAVSTVLVPEMARHGDHDQAQNLARECHQFEISMIRAKGRLYGSAQLAGLSWQEVWDDVVQRFDSLSAMEQTAVTDLAYRLSPEALDTLAARLCHVEQRAPTRPHASITRGHRRGRLTLAALAFTDGIWDSFEGRYGPPSMPLMSR